MYQYTTAVLRTVVVLYCSFMSSGRQCCLSGVCAVWELCVYLQQHNGMLAKIFLSPRPRHQRQGSLPPADLK